VADGNGQNRKQLTNLSGRNIFPAWSSDGKRLVYQHWEDGQATIGVIDADGQNGQEYRLPPLPGALRPGRITWRPKSAEPVKDR
jgi:Tol biopolymer transport system component